MKLSKLLHVASIIVGLVGVVTFAGALSVGSDGMIYGITKFDALFCVAVLMLIAIWLAISTIHHMMLEKQGELI